MIKILAALGLSISLCGCDPKPRPIQLNKFTDIELQKIYTHQYNRSSQELFSYLLHESSVYRAEAALAFSSIQDTAALGNLHPLLFDPDSMVRINAAFAIGQTKSVLSELELMAALSVESSPAVKRFMLEALGRVSSLKGLNYLAGFATKNLEEETGKAWGIYRAALNGLKTSHGTQYMLEFANPEANYEAKLAAGHYFYRFKLAPKTLEKNAILLATLQDNPEIRMVYTRVLGNFNTEKARNTLLQILKNDSIYNVRTDAVYALQNHTHNLVKEAVWHSLLTDKHTSVRVAASEFFVNTGRAPDFLLVNQAVLLNNWRVRANMLTAFVNGNLKLKAYAEMKTLLEKSTNNYEQSMLIKGLLSLGDNVEYMVEFTKEHPEKSIIEAASHGFNLLLDNGSITYETFRPIVVGWLQSGNARLINQAAHFISKPHVSKKLSIPEEELTIVLENIKNAQKKLAENSINKALYAIRNPGTDSLNWTPVFYDEPKAFRTFNWNNIVAIPTDLKIEVFTEKGIFTLQMLVEEAPFTVAHFIELIKEKAFEGIPFYRVVPNFVNQTGGAKSPEFEKLASIRIRSELAKNWHRTATINMASYGRDTESSHFSIMLCPTPWNDNNYTIFAIVSDNFDVVNKLEMGDLIYGMEILAGYKL